MKSNKMIKSEYLTCGGINSNNIKSAADFVQNAKKISRTMSVNYNQKKKAYESAATSYHTSGALDISRIHSYRTSDDIFRKNVTLKEGSSHGLVCTLDFSMSMSGLLPQVAMQFLITALFSKYIGIEFRMFTFTTSGGPGTQAVNPFRLDGSGSYHARFVDIGNQTMTEGQIIESFYHILSYKHIISNGETPFSREYTRYIKNTFGDMGYTPLHAALYQSFLIAKNMQERGIQNVNIIAINDGDNNEDFSYDNYDDKITSSIEDPFTRRIYNIEYGINRGSLISPINKMIRENGIKIYNIYLANGLSESDRVSSYVNSYVRMTDIPDDTMPQDEVSRLTTNVLENGLCEIRNLCFYDNVMFVDPNIFPKLNNVSNLNASDSDYISSRSKMIKKLSLLGTIISNEMVADFKLSNLK